MSDFTKKKSGAIFLFFLISLSFFLFACSFSSTAVSIDEQLAEIDSLIAVGDYDNAWSSLRKVAKSIRNPFDTLGIVRRALLLQKNNFAKEQLFDALEKTPEQQELLAVYSHILITETEYEKALPYARKLIGGEYGSIYSELQFIMDELHIEKVNSKKKDTEALEAIDYYSEEYVQAYIDIHHSTGNSEYLRNAALIYALQGNMTTAFSFHPTSISAYESPWFWAQISYDAHKFAQVTADLNYFDIGATEMTLLADAYVHLGLLEEAQRTWLLSTQRYSNENPIAWHNTAMYYHSQGNRKNAHDIIVYIVNTFPSYVGGLSAYGRFSLDNQDPSPNSMFTSLLKEKGLQSLQMSTDSLIVPLYTSDAMGKMDNAIQELRYIDESSAMELVIERLKLDWATESHTIQQKVADIWNILEQNTIDDYGYNDILLRYALWFFFTQGMIDEADGLFSAHCTNKYTSYYESLGMYKKVPIDSMEGWEYEYGSYIALKQERYNDASAWLTAIMPHNMVSPTTPVSAVVNLSTLYNATGKRSQALALYEQLIVYVKDSNIKAEVYYRMALIQYEMGEKNKASITLDEALLLDSNHSAARLLLKSITG